MTTQKTRIANAVDGRSVPVAITEQVMLITDPDSGLMINVRPLIDLILSTSKDREEHASTNTLNLILADIAKGCNCDRKNEVHFLAEANILLWELHRVFHDMTPN